MSAPPAPSGPDAASGRWVIQASVAGTVLFSLTAVAAAIRPSGTEVAALIVALSLFILGVVTFLWAFFVAVGRSREEEIAVSSLFFLSGSAPVCVRRNLLGSVALETIVGLATAAARPFTSLAFGALVPLYGLGMAGLWAARYGTFPRRSRRPRPVP